MSSTSASIPLPYVTAKREAINPWIIGVTVTLATFMELLDTAIANVALPLLPAASPLATTRAPGS